MRREYEVSFRYLRAFAEKEGRIIDFKDIDLKFYEGFTKYLQDQKLAVNTIGKKIQTLKIFLNSAKEEGLNNYDSFKSKKFVAITEDSDNIYLNEDELKKIYETDFSNRPGLDRVRDLFLVGCWTGCRFSDLSLIKPESIQEGMIHLKQHKTGTKVVIPLHPVVSEILNKYEGRLPEPISNQKFNLALKDIAKVSGIKDIAHISITKGGVKRSTAYQKHESSRSRTTPHGTSCE